MHSRLDRIEDWDEELRRANWNAAQLAQNCEVGEWELRHYVRVKFGPGLHDWIIGKRMKLAGILVREMSVKQAALTLGYTQVSHFSRQFKAFYGISPSRLRTEGGTHGEGI